MRKKSLFTITMLLVMPLALLIGCSSSDSPPPLPAVEESRPHDDPDRAGIMAHDPDFIPLDSAEAYFGVRPNGAGYRIEVPEGDNWNGALVMYAHGYRGTHTNLTITNVQIRTYLIENGYAWGASSYSRNWYDVRSGVEDTNELALAFGEITGRDEPHTYYIIGHSMGGHIAAAAVEMETLMTANNVVYYSGAVPMCGVVGDLYNYFQGYIKAAEQLAGYPATSFPNDPDVWVDVTLPAIKEALWVDFDTSANIMTSQGEKLKRILMNLSGGRRPLFDPDGPHMFSDIAFPSYQNLLLGYGADSGTSNGVLTKINPDTTGIVYRWESTPGEELTPAEELFNDRIFRIERDPDANRLRIDGLRWIPMVHGNFNVPVVTLHDLGDLFVPFVMEQEYLRNAMEIGSDDLLVQRAIRTPSHCGFNPDEMIAAFEAMIDWAEDGIVPEGDEILDPAVLADPFFGCTFTTVDRPGMPSCTPPPE